MFLRSFSDDAMRVEGPWFDIRTQLQKSGFYTNRFERALEVQLRRYGILVAIGRPGEKLPSTGAAREYVADEEWKARVSELIRGARVIFILPGAHDGVLWELSEIERLGAVDKTVFVVPPSIDDATTRTGSEQVRPLAHWDAFLHATAHLEHIARLRLAETKNLLFARVRSDGSLLLVQGEYRRTNYYREGLAFALNSAALPSEAIPRPPTFWSSRTRWFTGLACVAVALPIYLAGRRAQAEVDGIEYRRQALAKDAAQETVAKSQLQDLSYHASSLLTVVRGQLSPYLFPNASRMAFPLATYSVECVVERDGMSMTTKSALSTRRWDEHSVPFECSWSLSKNTVRIPSDLEESTLERLIASGTDATPSSPTLPRHKKFRDLVPKERYTPELRALDELDEQPGLVARRLAQKTIERMRPQVRARLVGELAGTTYTGTWQSVTRRE